MAETKGRKSTGKPPRKPHNARKSSPIRPVGELARAVGAEPRRATIRGKEVVMSLAERLARVTVESAINGSISDLKLLIQMMIKHPAIAASSRERWVLTLAGTDAEL